MKTINAIKNIEKVIEMLDKVECTDKTADALEIAKMSSSIAIDRLKELEVKINNLI